MAWVCWPLTCPSNTSILNQRSHFSGPGGSHHFHLMSLINSMMLHCTMAKSLSAWLRCFLALYPGRRNSIFLFLASILFLCFLSFFLAATSGLATAWGGKKCKLTAIFKLFLFDFVPIIPAWLGVVCVLLAAVRTLSGQQRMPERISPTLLVSLAALSAHLLGSSMWDLDEKS